MRCARRPIRPPALAQGDAVALVCPASPPASAQILRQTASFVESLGFEPVIAPHARRRKGYLAGSDAQRAADLTWALEREEIRAIFAVRGGYGSVRILPQVTWEALVRQPKVIIGMSDVTAVQMAALRSGVVTFAGPLLVFDRQVGWSPWAWEGVKRLVVDGALVRIGVAPGDPDPVVIVPGTYEGPVVGGNLSTLVSLIGTPWEPPLAGCILVLEDVNEAPYRVDRMLTQFLFSGRLAQVGAVALGRFHGCFASDEREVIQVIAERLRPLMIPTVYGLALGHQRDVATWPQGCWARLDASEGVLHVVEPGVV